MNLKILILIFKTDRKVVGDPSKLRGCIANKFPDYPILHHHVGRGYLYTYPRVQYKILDGTPIIVGIEEGADVLKEISDDLQELRLGKSRYVVESIQMNLFNADFGECRENYHYKFLTPWLALNPDNYKKFKETVDWRKKKEFLNNILVGNVLSMCKGLNHVVGRKLYVHSHLDDETVEYKAIKHIGFTGKFKINFKIPDLIGLGMGVSQGFGVVKVV